MRNIVIGLTIGLIIGVVLGVTILTPKLKSHAASKAVLNERELSDAAREAPVVLSALQDGDAIHWRSAPPFPSDRPNVAALAKDYSQKLERLSGDKMTLPVLPAKDVIAPDRLFKAIASGRIDALFATADIAVHKEPALSLFSAIPFGPAPQDMLAWLQAGNGQTKLREIFARHNITALVCGYLAPEAAGWFVNELTNIEQINTLRIRATGLGAKVWAKAGAKVTPLKPEDVPAAFDQDTLDAAVFSDPAQDARSGYSQFAKNYYFPGWHNQGHPLLLLINTRAWNKLDQERHTLLKASCDQQTALSHAAIPHKQVQGLRKLVKQEVMLKRLPGFALTHLEETWKQVLAEEIRKNKEFLSIWEDMKKFRKTRQTWQEMSRIRKTQTPY